MNEWRVDGVDRDGKLEERLKAEVEEEKMGMEEED